MDKSTWRERHDFADSNSVLMLHDIVSNEPIVGVPLLSNDDYYFGVGKDMLNAIRVLFDKPGYRFETNIYRIPVASHRYVGGVHGRIQVKDGIPHITDFSSSNPDLLNSRYGTFILRDDHCQVLFQSQKLVYNSNGDCIHDSRNSLFMEPRFLTQPLCHEDTVFLGSFLPGNFPHNQLDTILFYQHHRKLSYGFKVEISSPEHYPEATMIFDPSD